METIFNDFKGVEIFFLLCAVIGSAFVVIRLIMVFMGLDHDTSPDGGDGFGDGDTGHSDSDAGFRYLSLHGITSFFMMFGLVGLALYRQSRVGVMIASVGATVAGFFAVWVIGKLFVLGRHLESSGTIEMADAVGAQGHAYMAIPENGTGRVLVNINNSLREYDARADDDGLIKTGTPVRVVWVDGNVLVVEKI
ncbi:MAG: NfeD family protein [Pseudomonadota bacterium]